MPAGSRRCRTDHRLDLSAADVRLLSKPGDRPGADYSGGGSRPDPELDRLSNILKTFNDQFGHILWEDEDRVRRLITEEIPAKVAEDTAYRNARKHSDRQNARIEHDEALRRVMTAVLNDDMQLFKQFSDNESFRRCLTDTIFSLTYEAT